MGFFVKITVHRIGGPKNVWDTGGYGLSRVWVMGGSTVYLFPYLLALALRPCSFWPSQHRNLLQALLRFQNPSASDSTIRLHITANQSSSHSRSRPRRSTLHQSLCQCCARRRIVGLVADYSIFQVRRLQMKLDYDIWENSHVLFIM